MLYYSHITLCHPCLRQRHITWKQETDYRDTDNIEKVIAYHYPDTVPATNITPTECRGAVPTRANTSTFQTIKKVHSQIEPQQVEAFEKDSMALWIITVEVTESTPATMQEQPGQCAIYDFSRFFYMSCLRLELLLLLSWNLTIYRLNKLSDSQDSDQV